MVSNDFDTQIDTFKTEKLVRVTLAKANYKTYLEKINAKQCPQGEKEVEDLAREAIDNTVMNIDHVVAHIHGDMPKPKKGRVGGHLVRRINEIVMMEC